MMTLQQRVTVAIIIVASAGVIVGLARHDWANAGWALALNLSAIYTFRLERKFGI